MLIRRIPAPLRIGVFALAVGTILWLSLAPAEELPGVSLWDKAQHALAYAGLAALGLALFPNVRTGVAVGLLALGAGVEVAQSAMGMGREGDAADALANAVGVGLAWGLFSTFGRRRSERSA